MDPVSSPNRGYPEPSNKSVSHSPCFLLMKRSTHHLLALSNRQRNAIQDLSLPRPSPAHIQPLTYNTPRDSLLHRPLHLRPRRGSHLRLQTHPVKHVST